MSREDLAALPSGAIWNAFVDLLAMTNASDLSAEQLPAQRAFWYDAEVGNGGHLQYFLNRGTDEARSAVLQLRLLGADQFSDLLEKAVAIWDGRARERPTTAQEYVDIALENEFGDFDAKYDAISPTLYEILQAHVAANQDRYVVLD